MGQNQGDALKELLPLIDLDDPEVWQRRIAQNLATIQERLGGENETNINLCDTSFKQEEHGFVVGQGVLMT